MNTFRIVRDKVHIEYCNRENPHFNPGFLLSKYAQSLPIGYTDPKKRNRFFCTPLKKYTDTGVGFTNRPRGHGYMDNILKTIMKKGACIDGHFVNHQGRGACISALLDSGVHPEFVCKRTGQRNAKTLFDNYYNQSHQKRLSNTMAVMGGVEEKQWGAVPVLPVKEDEVIPREVLSQSRENKVPESKATEVATIDAKRC